MDPLEIIPDVFRDDLLQYFNVFDALEVLSLVSKGWCDAVGKSNHCMKKVRLNLRSKRKTDFVDRIETLIWMSRKGGRSYQHLQINCLLDETITEEVWSFLEATSSSVETLNLRSMKIVDFNVTQLTMPKLEDLKMMFVPRDAMNSLMTATTALRKLILRNEFPLCYDGIDYTPSADTLSSVKKCVAENQKLEELELQGRPHFFSFFQEDISKFTSFCLKKLVVKVEMSAEKIAPEHEANLVKFLVHQANCLEHIYIDSCSAHVLKHVFNSLPKLNFIRFDIELREPNNFVIEELNIEPNERITQLELPYITLFDDVKKFLALVPNVERILVKHIIPKLIAHVVQSLPKITEIIYRYDDCADGCDKTFENMKRENPEISQSIVMSIYDDFL